MTVSPKLLHRIQWVSWLVIGIAVLLGLRLYQLQADPPPSFGIQFISDEGWWVHNARNKAVFGQWILDEFNQSLLISPTYCVLVYGCFSLFGAGFFAARLPSVVAGVLLSVLVAAYVRRRSTPLQGLGAGLLMGLNYSFLCLNRVAFVDSLMLLFASAALFTLSVEESKPGLGQNLLGGILFGLALGTKSYSLLLGPVIVSYWAYELLTGVKRQAVLFRACAFTLGTLITLVVWYFSIFLPFQADFTLMYSLWSDGNLPHSVFHAVKNGVGFFAFVSEGTVTVRAFLSQNSLLLMLFWLLILDRLFLNPKRGVRTVANFEMLAYLWLSWSCLFLLPLTAKPMRRYIILLPPLIILVALYILDHAGQAHTQLHFSGLTRTRRTAVSAWLAIPLTLLLLPSSAKLLYAMTSERLNRVALGVQTGVHLETTVFLAGCMLLPFCSLIFYSVLRLHKTIRFRRAPLLILVLAVDLLRIITLHHSATFSQYETSKELGALFTKGSKVLGGVADSLCLENKGFAFAIWGRQEARRVLNERPVARFNPDYLLIVRKLDIAWPPEERYLRYARQENYVKTLYLFPKGDSHRAVVDVYTLNGVTEP